MTWREAMDALRRAAEDAARAERPEDRLRLGAEVKRLARITRALTSGATLAAN